MREAAADGECLDWRTWVSRACWVESMLAVFCTEGVVLCDFPDRGGHAGSLANQSSSSGPLMEVLLSRVWSFVEGRVALSLPSWSTLADLGVLS